MRLNIKLLVISVFAVFLLGLFSCSEKKAEKEDTTELQYAESITKIVNQVTSGEILPYDRIEVKFVNDVVEMSEVNKAIENPFSFSPSISGEAQWESANLLVFKPSESLKTRTNYTGKLNLSSLSENFKDDLDFKFYVAGRNLTALNADLELQSPNNPKLLVYKGKLTFSQKTDLEKVKEAASFTSSSLNWNQENDLTFTFTTEALERGFQSEKYTFKLDKSELDLEESFTKEIEIAPLAELKVTEVQKDEQGKYPKVMLKFSDELNANQQIDGFVTSEPKVDFKVQKLGKYIALDGKFKFGTKYKITIESGLKSRWGTSTKNEITETVSFDNIQPQVEFASDGIFMPTSNEKKLQFLSTNVKRVHVEIKKILDDNIEDFFRREVVNSSKQRNAEFRRTYVSSVGAIIYNQTLEIGEEMNEWLLHEVDLSNVLKKYDNGLYLVRINFNPKDVLIPIVGDDLKYIQKKGQIFKPITISDIGLIAKYYANNQVKVFATDLVTGEPMQGVKVSCKNYNSGYSGRTDAQGMAVISGYDYYAITAEKDGQISIIKPHEMTWNNSGYDIGGLSEYDLDTRAYIYTERGVYRPGDSVNVSCIVRYGYSSRDNVPADFKLFNPEGTLVHEDTYTGAKDGFYNFNFTTDQNDPTGDWQIQIIVGNKYFYHNLKIESVVANRLKAKVSPEKSVILPENKNIKIDLEARYLFGASASDLSYKTDVEILKAPFSFNKYKGYTFNNGNVDFQDIKSRLTSGSLDDEGKASFSWNVPSLKSAPSPLLAKINAFVTEKGGRPVHSWTFVNVHPFSHYVGISNQNSYLKLNNKVDIPVIVVNHKGDAVTGRELKYRIYRNDSHWWYQYDSYSTFRMKFKTDKYSQLVEEGAVSSATKGSSIPFLPVQKGQYLIEIQDGQNGHVASKFFSAYPWGGIPTSDKNEGTLSLRSEKDTYDLGEEVKVTFPSPRKGNVLLTVEQGEQLLLEKWVTPDPDNDEMSATFNITRAMVPNIYVTVTVIQNHAQTVNDRPIRMFGILPITAYDPTSKQKLAINMPDELKPKEEFDVEISALNGKQTQFTIAIVDEGLLDLTNFKTPNPWKKFYQKIRLEVLTRDLFGHVIGANKGDVFKTFSIGGDEDYRAAQVDPFKKKKRFKPVCMFKGPLMTDSNGKAKVHFKMPNYVGSVRVMVIGANKNSYASEEKTVPVRSDLIVQPTIPRALKPGDEFEIPVNLFATKDNIGSVDLQIKTEGPIEIIGNSTIKHTFNKEDDQMFFFKAKVKSAIGQSKITITAKGNNALSTFEADVPVSPSSPRVYEQTQKVIKPGQTITMKLPKLGIDGTNEASLNLSVFPNMDFNHRLYYLIRYPYGCIEQTTSSVFPQLMLKDVLITNEDLKQEVDKNINAGIQRLRMFQLSNGGFSYWPGGQHASDWGSNYAGQFLIEARKKGYFVPDGMYNGIVRYLQNKYRSSSYSSNPGFKRMLDVNRCFILALAGKAPMSDMNVIKQSQYDKLNSVQKWQLVAAYKMAGAEDKIKDIVDQIKTEVAPYKEFAYSYGSNNRDLGIILRCLVIMKRDNDADLLAKTVAKVLSGRNWYSTQTVGQMLLGMGSYFNYRGISAGGDVIIEGEVTLPNGKEEKIKSVDSYDLQFSEGYGQDIKITLSDDVKVEQLFVTVSSNGVPLLDETKEENKNINLSIEWYDENGNSISINDIKQGQSFYGRYRAKNESVVPTIQEMALVQILPSGWEIENTRLANSVMPDWMDGWNLNYEKYLDIRDDRIMWFFDLGSRRTLDFVVKINAVTTGNYTMPGAKFEAMYDNDFIATKEAKKVKVTK